MDFTVELAKFFHLSPFEILSKDKDNVIMLINYFIEKDETAPIAKMPAKNNGYDEPEKIKVTDATASGGWW